MTTIQYASAFFAIAAAFFWFKSAVIKTPERFSIHVASSNSYTGKQLQGDALGSQYVGHGHSEELNELGQALRLQSRWSAWAAGCASVSAVLQAIAISAETFR